MFTGPESTGRKLDAAKALQRQRASLIAKKEDAEKALAAERLAHEETNDILKQSVKATFDEALGQRWVLNPQVKLNFEGYDYRAYIDEGVLVPYHSPEPEEPRAEAEEGAGNEASPEGEAAKKVEGSGAGTAPPS